MISESEQVKVVHALDRVATVTSGSNKYPPILLTEHFLQKLEKVLKISTNPVSQLYPAKYKNHQIHKT
jgi:hypothetical protein